MLSNEFVKDAEAAQDALTDLQTASEGLRNHLVAELIPTLTAAVKGWLDLFGLNLDQKLRDATHETYTLNQALNEQVGILQRMQDQQGTGAEFPGIFSAEQVADQAAKVNEINDKLLAANKERERLLQEQADLEQRRQGVAGVPSPLAEPPPAPAPAKPDRGRELATSDQAQADALKALTAAHAEYTQSRLADTDVLIAKSEEEFRAWQQRQAERQRAQEQAAAAEQQAAAAEQARIEAGGKLPDQIDAANVAAQGLASTFTDLDNLNLDNLLSSLAQIPLQLAQAVLQALIFKAIMGGAGLAAGPTSAPTTGPVGPGGTLGHVAAGAAFIGGVRRMATGGFITNRPTIIPMANGSAMMSEYGQYEAVMPLKRLASGDLGVAAERGGNDGPQTVNNIYANQIDPGTVSTLFNLANRGAPRAVVNAQARGLVRDERRPPF